MSHPTVEVQCRGEAPRYATELSSGADLRSAELGVTLRPGATKAFRTGLYLAIPAGHEGQVRSKSGVAALRELVVLNQPGTLDADYRGEVMVLLHNIGRLPQVVKTGDAIAQLVLCPVVRARFTPVSALPSTARGHGGFGSTGP